MIAATADFIPTTDEVWRLQRGSDPESRFFQEMAEHGHYGGNEGGTRQGIYVCAPSGKFLASVNSTNPEPVLEMLERGLAAWRELPDEQRRLSEDSAIKPQHRWEDSFPVDGLVLTMITRDLPPQCDPSQPCEVKWNQDQVWFSRDEARRWLPADPQPGDRYALPTDLVARLARFHLVDTVKGQSSTFSREGVKDSEVTIEVIDREGPEVTLKISGLTRGRTSAGWWRDSSNGVVSQLLGNAAFDLQASRFKEFELVAVGRRWGATRLNGRRRDPDQGPLGFVFRLASPNTAPIAPAFIAGYEADWVVRPRR